jgi:esterase/lipase superfamily enzyme
MPRSIVILFTLVILTACAPRASILPPVAGAPEAQNETVFVATARIFDGLDDTLVRSPDLSFARYDVNVPADREAGVIPYSGRQEAPDPNKHFLVSATTPAADGRSFGRQVAAELRTRPAAQREVVLYVHGYNNTFADGLFRMAQMRRDLDLPGVPVHYAWPSAGHPLGYAYDRDSALFARDGLEALLTELAQSGVREIVLIAHSMGALVTMEALRSLHLRGQSATLSRIGGVILLSPDLDIDVFRAQAARIKPLPDPFVIFTSQRDRALAVSARITGQTARLGNLGTVDDVADLAVTLIDLSNVEIGAGDAFNHFTVATSPSVIRILRRVAEVNASFEEDPNARTGLLPGTVLTLRSATQIILAPGTP